ncbi:hypothetical protein H5410_019255 [Solanum commersonii]|uniref:Uncharacterized protein n=1 Tax=Solanum commersonii TaxID=4109 RepID=A0A9J6A5S9_SOLCO|nr:hypothetical protein H5410_019255 [Solanum commersonii]
MAVFDSSGKIGAKTVEFEEVAFVDCDEEIISATSAFGYLNWGSLAMMTMKISTHEDVMVPVMAKSPLKPCSETLTEVTMLAGPLHVGSPTDHFRWMSNISPFSVRLITARETSATKGLPFGKTCSFSKDKLEVAGIEWISRAARKLGRHHNHHIYYKETRASRASFMLTKAKPSVIGTIVTTPPSANGRVKSTVKEQKHNLLPVETLDLQDHCNSLHMSHPASQSERSRKAQHMTFITYLLELQVGGRVRISALWVLDFRTMTSSGMYRDVKGKVYLPEAAASITFLLESLA